jgi:GDPmannose 4,6-dehydratase
MWLMLQQEEPADYVIATGTARSVRELCAAAFDCVGLDPDDFIEVDPRFLRPADIDALTGDATKARARLGWEPTIGFTELVREMVEADLRRAREPADPPLMRLAERRAEQPEVCRVVAAIC